RLSFSAAPGEIFGLVGPDGAGKTTTLRMLAGVLPPDQGWARVAGCDVVGDPEGVKNHISYMPQRFGLYDDLTVEENIRFYADLFGVTRRHREQRAARLLAASGMSEFRHRLAGKLSGGMKQKLGLTCALIHTPRVILLDEPTLGVDPISRRDFWRILYELLAEGVTILISTSYLDEAERRHRLALLHEGRLLFCDTPARLKTRLPGAVVAVRSPEARRLRDVLTGADGVTGLVLVGDGVHLMVDEAQRRIPELEARLAASGLPFTKLAQITPTIEDLFVAAVEGRTVAGEQ
ncbi:MAG: ATP-binding cassette domain-containing protein, partial [Candidatus Acidiferrales bacterium]